MEPSGSLVVAAALKEQFGAVQADSECVVPFGEVSESDARAELQLGQICPFEDLRGFGFLRRAWQNRFDCDSGPDCDHVLDCP